MATANQKRILKRLEQIKERAAEMTAESSKANPAAELAEEAAGLGLQLMEKEK